jgi:antitoxin HicB
MYHVTLTPDDNGTVLVTCSDLPEVTTYGEDEEDAVARAADAIEEALAARIARCEDIPAPSVVPEGRAAGALREVLAAWSARHPDVPSPSVPATERAAAFQHALHEDIAAFSMDWLGMPQLLLRPKESGLREIRLPPLAMAKVALYRAMRVAGVSKAELGRRLGWHGPQVDRLFDLNHRSTIEHLDQALRAIGKRLGIRVEDAA